MTFQETKVHNDGAFTPMEGKAARYGWVDPGAKGRFMLIPKARLQVDAEYQREYSEAKRLHLAANFNWPAFCALAVVQRADGSFFLLDGQHRWRAALSRDDVDKLPCMVFAGVGGKKAEATAFLEINTARKALSGVDRFKAQAASGDDVAKVVARLIHESGRLPRRTSGPSAIACVQTMYRCVKRDEGALLRIWPVVLELCTNHPIENRIVSGLHHLEMHLADSQGRKVSITEPSIRRRLCEVGHEGVTQAIAQACSYYARGGEVVCAQGVLNLLNKHRRNRLQIQGLGSDD